jgi:MraZ protein
MRPFRGTSAYSLDAKNRLTVPARYRADFGRGLVMAKGTEPCVALWVPEDYDAYAESVLADYPPFSEEADKLQRFFFASSQETELDGAGRIQLPPFLLQHAKLTKEVVVTGARNRLEVWDRDAWADADDGLVEDVKEIRRRASHAAG